MFHVDSINYDKIYHRQVRMSKDILKVVNDVFFKKVLERQERIVKRNMFTERENSHHS